MKMEAVDRRTPSLIRVASVEDVEDYRIKVDIFPALCLYFYQCLIQKAPHILTCIESQPKFVVTRILATRVPLWERVKVLSVTSHRSFSSCPFFSSVCLSTGHLWVWRHTMQIPSCWLWLLRFRFLYGIRYVCYTSMGLAGLRDWQAI